ncbi:hypothetical protein D1872_316770 [compost metagenome]
MNSFSPLLIATNKNALVFPLDFNGVMNFLYAAQNTPAIVIIEEEVLRIACQSNSAPIMLPGFGFNL